MNKIITTTIIMTIAAAISGTMLYANILKHTHMPVHNEAKYMEMYEDGSEEYKDRVRVTSHYIVESLPANDKKLLETLGGEYVKFIFETAKDGGDVYDSFINTDEMETITALEYTFNTMLSLPMKFDSDQLHGVSYTILKTLDTTCTAITPLNHNTDALMVKYNESNRCKRNVYDRFKAMESKIPDNQQYRVVNLIR